MSEMENAMLSNEEREYIKDYVDETLDRRMVESKDWKAIYDRDVAKLNNLIESQSAGKRAMRDEIDAMHEADAKKWKKVGDKVSAIAAERDGLSRTLGEVQGDVRRINGELERALSELAATRRRAAALAQERDELKNSGKYVTKLKLAAEEDRDAARKERDALKIELKETGDRYGKCAVELDFAKKNVAYEQSVNEPFRKHLDELTDERDKLKVELEFMRAERDSLKGAQGGHNLFEQVVSLRGELRDALKRNEGYQRLAIEREDYVKRLQTERNQAQHEQRIAQVSLEGCCKRAQSYSESFNELSAIHVKVKAELDRRNVQLERWCEHNVDDAASTILFNLGSDKRFQIAYNPDMEHKWTISQFGRTVSATRLSEALKDLQA